MSWVEWSDEALMGRFRDTLDEEAFRELAARHYDHAVRLAQWHCGDAGLAQDAVQETLIRIVRHRRRYQPAKPFAPWFHTILRNVCRDQCRARMRRQAALEECRSVLPLQTPDLAAIRHARAVVGDLPADDARLLELRYMHGFTFQELAARLGCSLEAAKKRVQRVIQSLRARRVPFRSPRTYSPVEREGI